MKYQLKKRWGQHFLTDTNLLKKIVRIVSPDLSDSILEIGPGGGALTELLAPLVNDLVGVEVDRELCHSLQQNGKLGNCTFLNADFLRLDLTQLPFEGNRIRAMGNIPYNITSPIIFKLLESPERWTDIHIMVQKEVADRLTAPTGTRSYGRLTVMVGVVMDVKYELTVPPEVFVPRPKIDSAVVSLKYHGRFEEGKETMNVFREIVRHSFSQRRKMLRNSLAEYVSNRKVDIDLNRRPETLSVDEFMDLARSLT